MGKFARTLALIAAGLVLATIGSQAEDVQLRSRAVGLLSHARVVSRYQGGPYNIRTEVSFTASAADGSLQGGTYTRVRGADGELREDLSFGDYSASAITVGTQRGWAGNWDDRPYAVSIMLGLVPFSPGMFDASDVIGQIKDGSYGGRPAVCVEFETVLGEKRLPGEVCADRANGTLLELRTGSKLFEYSDYFPVKGGLFPAHLIYRDGNFSLSAELKMFALEEKPEDEFVMPAAWTQGSHCKQWQAPVAKSAPQPRGEGAPDAPVIDVEVHFHVTALGAVSDVQVMRPVRPDLDAEAIKAAGKWTFQPGTCNGHPQEIGVDSVVHFQGWRVGEPHP